MKKTVYTILPAVFVAMFSCTQAPDSDKATTSEAKEVAESTGGDTYKVNPSESKIEWIGTKVSGYHVGELKIKEGEIQVGENGVTGGTFVLDMAGLDVTGPEGSDEESNAKLEGHLKSADFFEVEKFPEATMVITGLKPFEGTPAQEEEDPRQAEISQYKVSDPTHLVSGNLTIKGITKNVEFPAKITMTDNAIDAIAKFNIDRSQWNITYPGKPDDLIRNEIHLGIAMKATK